MMSFYLNNSKFVAIMIFITYRGIQLQEREIKDTQDTAKFDS
jgi:hypothetical protein